MESSSKEFHSFERQLFDSRVGIYASNNCDFLVVTAKTCVINQTVTSQHHMGNVSSAKDSEFAIRN